MQAYNSEHMHTLINRCFDNTVEPLRTVAICVVCCVVWHCGMAPHLDTKEKTPSVII